MPIVVAGERWHAAGRKKEELVPAAAESHGIR